MGGKVCKESIFGYPRRIILLCAAHILLLYCPNIPGFITDTRGIHVEVKWMTWKYSWMSSFKSESHNGLLSRAILGTTGFIIHADRRDSLSWLPLPFTIGLFLLYLLSYY